MIKKLVTIVLIFSLTSCATIFTKKTYKLEIKSFANTKVKVYDSIYNLPAKIEVKRSKNVLPIVLISDTIKKNYLLKPSISPKYLYGNLSFVHFAPIGYLVDLKTEKRFYYGKSIFLNISDTITQIKTPISRSYSNSKEGIYTFFTKNHITDKGQINVTFSIPWINNFAFKPSGEDQKNSTGFFGISTGIEYYHNKYKFISLNASAVIDLIAPVPASISYDGEQETLSALTISLTENHKFNRFTLGYGLNFSKNNWKLDNTEFDENVPNSKKPIFKSNYGIGFISNVYFRLGEDFYIGLNYKPTLLNIKPLQKFQYEHVISFDLMWKIRLKK